MLAAASNSSADELPPQGHSRLQLPPLVSGQNNTSERLQIPPLVSGQNNTSERLQIPPLVSGQNNSPEVGDENSSYPSWYQQINNQTLENFGEQLKGNNPNRDEHVVKNGVDWGTDGCSGGGQSGQAACDRHDVNTRTLQQHPGYWNSHNYRNAVGSQFAHDLNTLTDNGTIAPGMARIYSAGATELGTYVPGAVTNMPAWDPESSWRFIDPPPADMPELTEHANQQVFGETLGNIAETLSGDSGSPAGGSFDIQ
jgi:hypothetical protein